MEACHTCNISRHLTKDGHAIPLVADLAAIPLSLWTHEHGSSRPRGKSAYNPRPAHLI
jgi:hypothetical protein